MNRRVGILSTIRAPLLPLQLRALYDRGIDDLAVVLDSRGLSDADVARFRERTRGAFDDAGITLDDFADRGLPFHFVRSHNHADCAALLARLDCALLVNAGTPRKLGRAILDAPRQGVLNVHPGILPKYRGATCVEWALYHDDPVGNTAHFMTEEYDAGPILATEAYRFARGADYVDVRVRIYRESIRLMADTLAELLDHGTCIADCTPQPDGAAFTPIPDTLFREALDRLKSGNYSHVD